MEAVPFNVQISNSLCVGRRRPHDQDEDVFLFVVMNPKHHFSPELSTALRQAIKTGLSSRYALWRNVNNIWNAFANHPSHPTRHVPRFIIEVPEIPTTINGKKVEPAVKQTLSGKDVTPSNTVTNPDSISYFRQFRDLEREPRPAKL